MDYGQYVKNPFVISYEEFKQGETKRKKKKSRLEYRKYFESSNKEKKKFFGDDWKTDLRVVHSVNEKKNKQRKRELTQLILERTRSF